MLRPLTLAVALIASLTTVATASAQETTAPVEATPAAPAPAVTPAPPGATAEVAPLTLGEAIELALTRSFVTRLSNHDLNIARAQIDETWGTVYPKVSVSGQYVRNIEAPNPFQGSDASSLFDTFAVIPWLQFNETARLTGGMPISFEDFLASAPSSSGGSDNPFLVPNSASLTLAVSQVIYSGKAFAAIEAAEGFEAQQLDAVRQQAMDVVASVGRSYYQALLSQAQADVTRRSAERLEETLSEITQRVKQGILPEYQQLSTEVELDNVRTRVRLTESGVRTAQDALKLEIGLPIEQGLALRTELYRPDPLPVVPVFSEAAALAEQQRADLAQLRKALELLEIQRRLTRAEYIPEVNAFANAGLSGNIPDDPSGGPFSGDYWSSQVNVGVQVNWELFAGFASDARMTQRTEEIARARTQYEQALAGAKLAVQSALRQMSTAVEQLRTQDRSVERAELNYRHAEARVREGVSSTLELREASQQLDESRLNRLQAVHDLWVAWLEYEVAVGTPPAEMRAIRPAAPAPGSTASEEKSP